MDTEIGTLAQSLQKRCCQVPFYPFPQHHTGEVLPASECCVLPCLFSFPSATGHCFVQGGGGRAWLEVPVLFCTCR